jgi:hypothetical protein
MPDWRVHTARRFDLRCRQARRLIAARAFQHARIEVARRGIGDEPILHAIHQVTRVQRRSVNRRILSGGI